MDFYKKQRQNRNFLGKIKTGILHNCNFFKNVTTFDVDGFDGCNACDWHPEPGGLLWEDVLPILKKVKISNVVGADINELAPIKNFDLTLFSS